MEGSEKFSTCGLADTRFGVSWLWCQLISKYRKISGFLFGHCYLFVHTGFLVFVGFPLKCYENGDNDLLKQLRPSWFDEDFFVVEYLVFFQCTN